MLQVVNIENESWLEICIEDFNSRDVTEREIV